MATNSRRSNRSSIDIHYEEVRIAQKMMSQILDLRAKSKIEVKYIRCDNAPESKKLEEACEKKGLGITFEYIAVATPQ